jgi:hypothetical protein
LTSGRNSFTSTRQQQQTSQHTVEHPALRYGGQEAIAYGPLSWRSAAVRAFHRPSTAFGSQVEIVGKNVTKPRLINSGTYQGIIA